MKTNTQRLLLSTYAPTNPLIREKFASASKLSNKFGSSQHFAFCILHEFYLKLRHRVDIQVRVFALIVKGDVITTFGGKPRMNASMEL
jgi:hypothetical protein